MTRRLLVALGFVFAAALAQAQVGWIELPDGWVEVPLNPTGSGSSSVPTGTGFEHITGGSMDAAARAVDVSSADVTGTLAAARFGALTGDVTSAGGTYATTLGANVVTNGGIRQSAALSLIGRSANSTGNVADISCTAASGNIFRESGSTIGCSALPVTAPVVNTTGTLSLSITTTNDGGAVVKQATTPGTQQGSGGNANFNLNGAGILETDSLGSTRQAGLTLTNPTASSGGATVQFSPALYFSSTAWNSSGAQSEVNQWRILAKPNTVAGATNATLSFDSASAGGAFSTDKVTFSNSGSITAGGSVTATSNFIAPASGGGRYTFNGHGGLNDQGTDGKAQYETSGGTVASYTSGVVTGSQLAAGIMQVQAGNGATLQYGSSTEQVTLSTGGTTTNSTNNLLPANAMIDQVVYRITTTITTATNFTIGDGTQAARFCGTQSVLTAGTTGVCVAHLDPTVASANLGPVQSAAAVVKFTTTGTPGAGVIRVTVFWHVVTPPTS